MAPEDATSVIAAAREAGLEMLGLHVHLGSQLLDHAPGQFAIEWLAGFVAETRAELDWTPQIVNLGGGLGIQHVVEEPAPEPGGLRADAGGAPGARVVGTGAAAAAARPRTRSIARGSSCATFNRVGVVKKSGPTTLRQLARAS